MSFYRDMNKIIPNPLSEDSVILKTVPPGYYKVCWNSLDKYHLQATPTPPMPPRLYGDVKKNAELVLSGFRSFGTSSVLLSGLKGCGKSLTLKEICRQAVEKGAVALFVEEAYDDPEFSAFVGRFKQPHCLVFDEFEKVYAKVEKQNALLSMLDGFGNREGRMVLITANHENRISEMLINRPGRIRYHLRHTALGETFVRDYCQDHLDRKALTDTIVKMSIHSLGFSFDLLSTLVEELNARPELSVEEVTAVLNIEATKLVNTYRVVRLECVSNSSLKLATDIGSRTHRIDLSSGRSVRIQGRYTSPKEDRSFDFYAYVPWENFEVRHEGETLTAQGTIELRGGNEEVFEVELYKQNVVAGWKSVGFGYASREGSAPTNYEVDD